MSKEKIFVTKASLPSKEEFFEIASEIFDRAWLTNMGAVHEELGEELCKALDTDRISLVVNGHLALELLIQALDLKGEVITTPFSFVSTTHALVRNGIKPVFCDIKANDFTIDTEKIEALITDKTSAILAVHVYGNICDNDELERIAEKHNIKLIYDAAHAFLEVYKGKSVANLGLASMFSFHATKVYNTIEGGAVTGGDAGLHEKLYYLKNFGIADKENVNFVGSNAKMNEFQAAMGLCNLRHVRDWIEKRKAVVLRYLEGLKDVEGIRCNEYREDRQSYNYAYYPIVIDENVYGMSRDELYARLCEENIYTRKYFYTCINELKCYENMETEKTEVAAYISRRVLTLPVYPDLSFDSVDEICRLIKKFHYERGNV